MSTHNTPVIYPATGKHAHTIIFLHGRDSTAEEFAPELFESQASDGRTLQQIFPEMKWVFLQADMIQSKRFGCEMSQWYDIHTTEDPHMGEDQQDLEPAVQRIQDIIAQESASVGAKNVVLAGISQGAAVGMHALLTRPERLGGFIGLCTWLPRSENLTTEATPRARQTPAFLAHSDDDDVIAIAYGKRARDSLITMGMAVSWKSYSFGGHWVHEPEGVDDIVDFLHSVLRGHNSATA